MTEKYLLSIVDSAKYFNIGRDKLYAIIRTHDDAPIIKIGNSTKINVIMFEQFLNKCTEEKREL